MIVQAVKSSYSRTGNVCLDALMQVAHLMGASGITFAEGQIACTYSGRRVVIPADPQLRCTAVIAKLQQSAQVDRAERRSDPAAIAAQLAA